MNSKEDMSQPLKLLKNFHCTNCNVQFVIRDLANKASTYPMLLQCGHSVCEPCLQQCQKNTKSISCQKCNFTSSLPLETEGTECFPHSFYELGRLIAIQINKQEKDKRLATLTKNSGNFNYSLKKLSSINSQTVCEECLLAASWYCENCKSNFCETCWSKVHGSAKSLMKHCKTSLSSTDSMKNGLIKKCSTHEAHNLEFYCTGCSIAICSHCLIQQHQGAGHYPITLKEKNIEMINEVKNAAEEAEIIKKRMKQTLEIMTSEYELCGNTIGTLPVVSLHSSLSEERIRNIPDPQNVNEELKNGPNIPVLQLHTLSDTDVNLHSDLNIQNIDKRLPGEYITLPLESNVKYSVSYICRICASVIDFDSAVNIFPSDEFQENLSFKINKYLPIIVYESDPFPKTVCRTCVTKLNQFHELAEKCALVEEQFRQTYVFDGRYIEELTRKVNQKSDLDLLKNETESNEQLYSISDFQYIANLNVNNLNPNSCKQTADEKKDSSSGQEVELKSNNFEFEKSQDIAFPSEQQENFTDSLETLSCKFCGVDIKNWDDCLEHSNSHIELISSGQFPCSYCGIFCKCKDEWEVHIKSHFETHSQEVKAGQALNSKEKARAWQQKILKHKLKIFNKPICCKKCREALDSIDAAVEHCLKHRPANIKSYPCVLCMRRIGKSKLREHISLHYPVITKPVFSCDNCNNLYPDEKTLKYHRCSKLRKFKCSQCKQGFKSEDRLKFHEEFHKNKSTFCEICKKDFKFESRIYLHFAGVHNGIRDKPYCCDVCGKTFTWLTVLNSHKRTHTNERPYKCPKCDARFCNKYSLSGHMPSHDDHPQFYCEKCDYHTGRKQNLQKHVSRFHKEINSSQLCIRCRVCNEIFPNKHHVAVEDHLSKHSREETDSALLCDSGNDIDNPSDLDECQELEVTKLYQCERCERCYASSDHLTQHRIKHAADDSGSFYRCRLCDNGFPKHDLLVKHQKVHVNISSQYTSKLSVLTVISCDICGIECVDYRQLLNHKDRGNCMMKKISGTVRPKKVLIKKHLKPLKTHQLFVNSNGLFECPTCQRTYKNRRRYRLHLATHSNTPL